MSWDWRKVGTDLRWKGTVWAMRSWRDGAGDRIRTGDINLGKVALYQLSYSRPLGTSSFLLRACRSVNSFMKLQQFSNIFHSKWHTYSQRRIVRK